MRTFALNKPAEPREFPEIYQNRKEMQIFNLKEARVLTAHVLHLNRVQREKKA